MLYRNVTNFPSHFTVATGDLISALVSAQWGPVVTLIDPAHGRPLRFNRAGIGQERVNMRESLA